MRIGGPDIVTAADKRAIAREHKKNATRKHFGSKGNVTTVKGKPKDDPVIGFLKSAAKFVAEDTARVVRDPIGETKKDVGTWVKGAKIAAKAVDRKTDAYVADRKEQFTHPHRYSKTHPSSMDVSPGMIGAIIKAGGASLIKPGRLPLKELTERFPKKHGGPASRAARVDESRQTGDVNVQGRIPWLVDRETGRVHVGPVGSNHGSLYPPGHSYGRYRQGWMHNPEEEFASITLGTGNPLTAFSKQEEQGLYQLLYHMLGRNSPVTDAMVKTRGTLQARGGHAFGARQGKRADDLLETAGGKMGHKEFNEFLEAELKRRRRR